MNFYLQIWITDGATFQRDCDFGCVICLSIWRQWLLLLTALWLQSYVAQLWIYLNLSLGISVHSSLLGLMLVRNHRTEEADDFSKERFEPWGCVRLYYTDTVSQPSLEGTLYESICVMLWQFNLCEQCDAISQPALLTMWITVSLDSV